MSGSVRCVSDRMVAEKEARAIESEKAKATKAAAASKKAEEDATTTRLEADVRKFEELVNKAEDEVDETRSALTEIVQDEKRRKLKGVQSAANDLYMEARRKLECACNELRSRPRKKLVGGYCREQRRCWRFGRGRF